MIDEYEHRYDDIINMPNHISKKHPRMSVADRAAQFSPFAALVGYGDAVDETARLTDSQMELDDEIKAELNAKLTAIIDHINEHPTVTITYFRPDERKSGGAYLTVTGVVKKVDEYKKAVVMTDKIEIPIDSIAAIESDILKVED